MSTPTTPQPEQHDDDIDQVVAKAGSSRPGWLIPVVVLAALAIIAALIGLFSGRGSKTDSAAPASKASSAATQAAGQSGRTVQQIKQAGTIRIGTFSDKAPFGSVDSSGKYTGYDIVYAERIAKDLGVKLELVPVEAASRVEFLTSGKVDVILANFTVTSERAEKVDFANPYMKVSLGVVTPKSAPLTEESQLAGKKTIVVKGTTAETYLASSHPDWNQLKFEQYTEATNALIDGRGDAWLTDNTEALAFAIGNQDKFVASITSLGPTDTIAPAVQKGNDSLKTWLNENLVELGKENFFHKNFEQTLKPVYGDAAKPEDLVVEGGKI